MGLKKIYKKYSNINIFILLTLFLLGFSLFYFLYYRRKNQVDVFVSVALVQKKDVDVSADANFNWIPRWIADSVKAGDKDMSPITGINAVVVEKEAYNAWSFGKFVYLLLKVRSVKDRSGIYLFKNKPLLIGSVIELKLSRTQTYGLVTDISSILPKYQQERLIVKLRGIQIKSWVAENIKVGSRIVNSKGETEIKVLGKKVLPTKSVGMVYEPSTKSLVYTDTSDKKDLEVTIEIIAKKINGEYFYNQTRKIRLNEWLYLPLKEVSISLPIISVEKAKD